VLVYLLSIRAYSPGCGCSRSNTTLDSKPDLGPPKMHRFCRLAQTMYATTRAATTATGTATWKWNEHVIISVKIHHVLEPEKNQWVHRFDLSLYAGVAMWCLTQMIIQMASRYYMCN